MHQAILDPRIEYLERYASDRFYTWNSIEDLIDFFLEEVSR